MRKPVLYDNLMPRHLPHMQQPQLLKMGLAPMEPTNWIETDQDLARYYRHKLQQRALAGEGVYRATPESLPAQRELSQKLLAHLVSDQPELYTVEGETLNCHAGDYSVALSDSAEPLWNCSLWVADDLVLMQKKRDSYCLTGASLCSPSHWRLVDKFERPMREIHDPVPGLHEALSPSIDRFLDHLKPERPVVRFNWGLQTNDLLNPPVDDEDDEIDLATPLYYRYERQSLTRLPITEAIVFTIRVYLHPIETLLGTAGALPALLSAIEQTPEEMQRFKNFDELAPTLQAIHDAANKGRQTPAEAAS